MAIKSGYYNSLNGDRKYNAETMSKYFVGLVSRGVLQNYLNKFQVISSSGMQVTLQTGKAYFSDGKWIETDAPINFEIDASSPTLNRIDRIVLRRDLSESVRDGTIIHKIGTPSLTPQPPELEEDEYTEEMSVAQIYIGAQSTVISQANITDERPNNEVCGWVHGLIEQVDTEDLFDQYDDAFNTWFSNVKETLATTTLIRQYTSHYTTITDDETDIPIGITQYNPALDILNVFINGLKLVKGVDYTQEDSDSTQITLAKGLTTGQIVDFEVFKSVDGSDAETVVQHVYNLQNQVNKLEDAIYYATGENDNIKLSQMCQEFFTADDLGDQMYIRVVGTNFTVTTPADGLGSTSSRYKWFNIGPAGKSTKRLILDFSGCNIISIDATNDNNLIFYGASCRIENLKMQIVLGSNATFVESPNIQINNCDIEMTASGTVIFGRRYGNFNHNRVYLTSNGGSAYCFEAVDNSLVRVYGGTYYAYTNQQNTSIVSAAGYVSTGQTNAILLMTNSNCPIVARSGYYQTNSIKINSGKATLIGNVVGEAISIYTSAGTNVTETGTIIQSIEM